MPPHRPGRLRNARPTAYGWQFYTRIDGELQTEHFRFAELKNGKDPTQREVDDWIGLRRAIAAGAVETPEDEQGTTFADDVRLYLAQVTSMTTYAERERDVGLWLDALGRDRDRKSITASEVRTQLEAWRKDGYAASTCNHKRTALMHLFTVLDGRRAPNPAADVPRYREPQAPPRALSMPAVRAILAAMPECQTKARLLVMAWTGWPQKQIANLQPSDIAWKKAVFIRGRSKGQGVPGMWLPVLPQGWTALRLFKKLGCWGAFSTSSMRMSFRRAAARVLKDKHTTKAISAEIADITPYQLRHSFGTLVSGVTGDDRAVQTLMLHSDIRQTHRYTSATVNSRTADALRKTSIAIARQRKIAG